jgi:hypothetical protein
LAGVEGLEPPTIGFGDRCSTNSNYTPVVFNSQILLTLPLGIQRHFNGKCGIAREGGVLYSR